MSHGHHHHVDPDSGDGKIALAVAINLGLTVAQVIGGIVAGSLSLIADALHNFSDAIALIIAFAARKIARRPANADMTFGYGRIEAVAALINYTTLIVIGLYLVYEAAMRFANPEPVAGWIVVIVAGIALLVDLGTAALTFRASKSSVNIRAAFLHNVADALGSVAVIVAGTLMILFGWAWVDPLATLLIAGYILWQSATELPQVARILMLASPDALRTEDVIAALRDQPGVTDVHHVHLWLMEEHGAAFDAHIVAAQGTDPSALRHALKSYLKSEFDLNHVTLELETQDAQCRDAKVIGH
ncbi:Cadmium, cobalt and zinc/H(+)-K(+) antiporter [Sulfitobacter pontiacus]|jgi:cobalt-zinc-cadmium efflux system protein|uniref:Cadmium, cobalt and zinc/H(+)-K(+) antiporter n=1 Tax=Sulfitobacter pontiacus TaxID=60137 RepID=A0AAX3AE25_9RHOB|nr:cation diffusion facilitator family transporter [Sulfitobacter pontiacus]UOA24119.1 Cadmium, cobalt and zinc/H(+)-K(+) antiporter [Sulfitobacter pontiacus]